MTLAQFTDLAPEKRERLRVLLTPRMTEYIAHAPTAKQHAGLLMDTKREVFFGGAAGGGKSDYLLMAFLQYADVRGYAGLLLRRTFAQLSKADGLLLRAQEWLAHKAHGSETIGGVPTRWTFPSGARLEFGHCQREGDKFDYQSAAYQYIGFDELTQFSENIYLYITSRLRRLEGSKLPLRIRSASNPGGIGHDWVKERFITSRHPQRAFLKSKLEDNPHLDREEYTETLMQLHPYERQQLLDGDWDARPPGSRFKREWFEIVDALPAKVERRVRRWDLAATEPVDGSDPDWTAGVRMSRHNGTFYVEDVQRFRTTPAGVDARLLQTAQIDGIPVAVRIEQEPGSSGKIAAAHFTTLLAGFDVESIPSTGDKVVRANPLASQAEAGNVKLLRGPWNEAYLQELEHFSAKCAHDDQVDGTSGALFDLTQRKGISMSDLFPDPEEDEDHEEEEQEEARA